MLLWGLTGEGLLSITAFWEELEVGRDALHRAQGACRPREGFQGKGICLWWAKAHIHMEQGYQQILEHLRNEEDLKSVPFKNRFIVYL